MSKGDQIRDFSEISEVVNQIIELSIKSKGSFIQNICSCYPESVKDFAEKIILKYNSSIKLNLGFYEYNKYEPFAFWGKPHDRLEF